MILTREQLRDVPLAIMMVDMNEQEREFTAQLLAYRFAYNHYWLDLNPDREKGAERSFWLTRLDYGRLEIWHGLYDSTVTSPYVLDFCEVYRKSIQALEEPCSPQE